MLSVATMVDAAYSELADPSILGTAFHLRYLAHRGAHVPGVVIPICELTRFCDALLGRVL